MKKRLPEVIERVSEDRRRFQVADILDASHQSFSRQYISSILNTMVRRGELVRSGGGRYTFYALPKNVDYLDGKLHRVYTNRSLEEHTVLFELESALPTWKQTRENIRSLIQYGFQEMLNNAIEHSQSRTIAVDFGKVGSDFQFRVRDHGIGVFRNVMRQRKLQSELEAMQDLLKGKTTTAPKAHSGEGIFFTSKAADVFSLESYGYRLRVDNRVPDIFFEEVSKKLRGTEVRFAVSLKAKKHLRDIFHRFQTDPEEYAFDRTEILVKLYQYGTIYISRSQARRLLSGLERFKTVVLDFDQVPTVGQAFADEIFRVFPSKHPTINIQPIHMNAAVAFMIGRVEKPQKQ